MTRAALGFDDEDLLSAPTKKQLKKSRESIKEAAFGYTSGTIFPSLHASISAVLDEGPSWQLRDDGEGVVTFGFPADPDLTVGSYLRPEVSLEIGGLSDLEPSGTWQVVPYAAEVVPEAFTQKATNVRVVLARRTLCDKLLLLHRLNTSGEDLPAEHSRHFYDVAKIADSPVRAELLADPGLLWRAIDYEGRTFPRGGIDYAALRPSDLRLSPADSLVPSLQRDYEAMREMFFSDPPGMAEIASALRGLEADLQAVPTRREG